MFSLSLHIIFSVNCILSPYILATLHPLAYREFQTLILMARMHLYILNHYYKHDKEITGNIIFLIVLLRTACASVFLHMLGIVQNLGQ
ncbi:hypothetical protein XELAEV_18037198mg [Xenopus laevis]|uniref:Uncharacterized protein n=1 Tax=Xenopus laevis TaxID=8355 RepID=A0A974H9X7_XENLA|nr:hypothetical protein XELAEV_18037198mg [Xenopus laevis]